MDSIWGPDRLVYGLRVSENEKLSACLGVPDNCIAILASGGYPGPIRRPSGRIHPILVGSQELNLFPLLSGPDPGCAIVADGQQTFAVR